MKRFIILLFLAFVCTDLKAQIYHSEVCFYIRAGVSLTSNTYITIVSFNGYTIKSIAVSKSGITSSLKESANYWDEYFLNLNDWGEYNSDLSTYSREVYTMSTYSNGNIHRAFSKDLSSFITWTQWPNSETIENKLHYKRIDKSELMPNEHLYDFLND